MASCLLLASLIAGFFWFLNFWARAKWIYTVPLTVKLFEILAVLSELPLPECALLYRALIWRGPAPAWRLHGAGAALRPGDAGHLRAGGPLLQQWRPILHGPPDHRLSQPQSRYPGWSRPRVRSLLEMRQCGAVWKAGRAKDLATAGGELAPQQLADLRRTSRLYLHQVSVPVKSLLRAGIRSTEELGQLPAETVLRN